MMLGSLLLANLSTELSQAALRVSMILAVVLVYFGLLKLARTVFKTPNGEEFSWEALIMVGIFLAVALFGGLAIWLLD